MTIPYASIQIPQGITRNRAAKIVIMSILVLMAVFVWPTLYRYESTSTTLVRINRVTGKPEMLSVSGWHELRPVNSAQPWESDPVIGTAQPKP